MKSVLFFIYQWLIFVPIFFIATLITSIVVIIGCTLSDFKFWAYYPPKYWSKLACHLAFCRIKIEGLEFLEQDKSYVFVPNHQSVFDIFLIYGYLNQDLTWVQKQPLRKIPLVGKACEKAGHIYIDKSSMQSTKEAVEKAKSELHKGGSIIIFPEGSRSLDGKIGRFNRGAFLIAKQMNLPIVPLTINGAFDVMKRKSSKLALCKKMQLTIHKPILMDNFTEHTIPQLMEESKLTIESSLWEKYR